MPFAAEIPKKKKPNYFDIYSGFADSPALSVQGGGYIKTLFKDERRILQGCLCPGYFSRKALP
jgi:hypothetical protein